MELENNAAPQEAYGETVTPNDLSFPTDQELSSEGYEIDNEDVFSNEPTDDGQGESQQEEMEHREEMTQQEMLDELARGEETQEKDGKEKTTEAEEFKIPEDFKDVLKRGDELHQVGYNEIKELAQKGYDYTQKTQELSNERKELETTFQQKEAELTKAYEEFKSDTVKHQKTLDDYNKFEYALQMMQEKDPDLFEHIAEYTKEAQRVLDNPVNRGLRSQLSNLEQKFQEIQNQSLHANAREKNEMIAKTFEVDLTSVKGKYVDTLKRAGLTPDWEKVKEAWIEGEKANTTVEQALFQVYGPQITKLFESKMKVKQVAAKVGQRPSISNRTRVPVAKNSKKTDWMQYENDIYNQLQAGTLEL